MEGSGSYIVELDLEWAVTVILYNVSKFLRPINSTCSGLVCGGVQPDEEQYSG